MTNESAATIREGFQIETPPIFIHWEISEPDLIQTVDSDRLSRVTAGYYTMECESLGGLRHFLGFHFQPTTGGRLTELEFFRKGDRDLTESFDLFQKHLVKQFGEPTITEEAWIGLPACRWQIAEVEILHYALDRFGPEEHVLIRNHGSRDPYWNAALKNGGR
jgi:hypothetical protein